MNCEPGISETAIKIIKKKVEDKQQCGEKLICSIVFDEMSIKKNVQWAHPESKMLGFPTYGRKSGSNELAKQAIVYILNGLNENFHLPLCYHFIASLDGQQKKNLLLELLEKLVETGIVISSITFDGHQSNILLCKMFGANINIHSPTFQPYFHLNNGHRIFIMLDPVHMLKLVRNAIGYKGVFLNNQNEKIEWNYFKDLVAISKSSGHALTHKMNQKHIKYGNMKMNVQVAVQTLSASTAESILFLKNLGNSFYFIFSDMPTLRSP